jgi:hypothetical protein
MFDEMFMGENLVFSNAYDVYGCGTLVTLTFRVFAEGMHDVYLIARECANGNLQWVGMESRAATITVIDQRSEGDVNGDGQISLTDLILLRRYLAEYDYDLDYSTVDVALGADMNSDGVINLSDLILLSRYLADYDYDTEDPDVSVGGNTGSDIVPGIGTITPGFGTGDGYDNEWNSLY